MLSEMTQRQILYNFYVETKKRNKLVNIATKQALTDKENKLVVTSGEKEMGRGWVGVRGQEIQTTMYKIKLQYTVEHKEYSQYCITINGV